MIDDDAVVVVGLGALFPGAGDAAAFWRNVVDGVDATGPVPPSRLDPALLAGIAPDPGWQPRGGFLPEPALTVRPGRFGIMPVVVSGAEPDQLLALEVAAAALDDVGSLDGVDRSRVGVVLGRGGYLTPAMARLDQRVRDAEQVVATLRAVVPELDDERLGEVRRAFLDALGPQRPEAAIGLVPNLAASRIANRLDLGGPAYTVDAACASALVAVDHACNELRSGRCDLVLAGGVHHCHDITVWAVFAQLGALSRSGGIRPFSRHADGILIGEGTGILAFERRADAERLGHRIYAVVAGTGLSSDGRATSLMSPSVEGQVLAIERAWRAAGLDPATAGLVEGHGTATVAGDATELETLRTVFGAGTEGDDGREDDGLGGRAALGSVKSMIGHAMPAAGAAGLVKAVLAVHHGVLPPSLHAEEPHPALAASRFRVLPAARPWEGGGDRIAGVNAFGFGGVNAHVVVRSGAADRTAAGSYVTPKRGVAAGPAAPSPARPAAATVLVLSGADTAEVAARLDAVVAGGPLPAPGERGRGPARLAVVQPDARRLALAAKAVAKGRPWRGRNDIWFEPAPLLDGAATVAFLYPGVEPDTDVPLAPVGDRFGLAVPALPEGCTPLEAQGRGIFTAGRVLTEALRQLGIEADHIAGHSLGEWTAAFAAELIPPASADAFVDEVRPGSFEVPGVVYLVLGCGVDVAEELLDGLDGVVVSHDNCVHQSIVCGPEDGVAEVRARAAARRVLAQELPFRSGFHTPAYEPYLGTMRAIWAVMPLQPATRPIWSATTCAPYPEDEAGLRALAVRHLLEPVRFRGLTEQLWEAGVRVFVQVGAGSLAGFVEDTLRDRPHLAVAALAARKDPLEQLARAAVACWVAGIDADLDALLGHEPAAAVAAPLVEATVGAAGPAVALELGVPLVRLPEPVAAGLAGALRPAARSAGRTAAEDAPARPAAAALAGLGAALGGEHSALLDDVVAAGDAVLAALAAGPGRGRVGAPGGGTPPSSPPSSAAPPPAAATHAAEEVPSDVVERRIRIELGTWPWLIDHAFFRQREGWADTRDLFPVVPMTNMVELLGEVASELEPGRPIVALERIRAMRWLAVDPPADVVLRARRRGPDLVEASIEGHIRALVRFGDEPPVAPPPLTEPVVDPEPSPCDAVALYTEHHMFHGPAYQGVRHLGVMGPNGMDGEIEVLPAPGAMVDAAGQMFGWWIEDRLDDDFLALPQSIERWQRFATPAAGTRLRAALRVRAVEERTVTCDLEIVDGDDVVVRVEGWTDRRFDCDADLWVMLRHPEHHLAAGELDGVLVVDERWVDSATRELMARRYLTADELAAYEARNPRAQRAHLLGRVAAKDAVRHALWAEGHGPLFPAEVVVGNDEEGRPYVRSGPGAGRPLSIAHSGTVGVALVGPAGGEPVGVDVELVAPRGDHAVGAMLADAERAVLAAAGVPLDDEWVTRAWCAKEAVAKAAGTGLQGRPHDFPVEAVDGERLLVRGRWVRTHLRTVPSHRSTRSHPDRPHPNPPAEEVVHVIARTEPS